MESVIFKVKKNPCLEGKKYFDYVTYPTRHVIVIKIKNLYWGGKAMINCKEFFRRALLAIKNVRFAYKVEKACKKAEKADREDERRFAHHKSQIAG